MNILPSGYDYRGNIFSQVSFFWIDKLLWKGLKRTLKQDDLYPCPREQCSEYLYDKFEKNWQKELSNKNRKPDIKIALAKTLISNSIISGICYLLEGLLIISVAVLFIEFASLFTSNNNTNSLGAPIGYTIAISVILIYVVLNSLIGDYYAYSWSIKLQTICNTALFKKILKLQQSTLHTVTIGHIINLISTETYKIQFGVPYWNFVWIAPVLVIVSTILILIWIGPIGLIGIACIIFQIPVEIILGYAFAHFNHLKSLTGDKRIELMDQIIRGMRVVKFYVWENPFIASIQKIRKKEVRYVAKSAAAQSVCYSLFNVSIFIAVFLTYITSIVVNDPLTSSQLAFLYILHTQLSIHSILYFGKGLMKARQSIISLRRIQNVLELPETGESCLTHSTSNHNVGIEMIDFSASWKGIEQIHNNVLVLKHISLSVNTAQLVVITGHLGCGKSSLLMSLINELPGLSGKINLRGVISYTEQQPWIFSGTFRDNILFGRTVNLQRLQEVISSCSLTDDIACFADGDMTVIGERGVTLSGGQKARVALARAVYQVADIYLLDDPLSAVDVKVGREIFDNCVRGLLSDKIVVLVTHQLQCVKQADWIVVMREGYVRCQGSYEDVLKDEFCQEFLCDLEKIAEREVSKIQQCNLNVTPSTSNTGDENETVEQNEPLSKFLTQEDFRPHASSIRTYTNYFLAGGLFATCVMLLLTILSYTSLYLSYWWMQSMSTCSTSFFTNHSTDDNVTIVSGMFCPWYMSPDNSAALGLVFLFVSFGSTTNILVGFLFYYIMLQASRRLHNRMLHRVMYCPMYFFDTNPSGRVLNRFSTDMIFLDELLPELFYYFWSFLNIVLFATIAAVIVEYYLLIPIIVLLILTFLIRYYSLKTLTQMRRIESIARSPLYSHISLTLLGLSTIRALKMEERVTQDYHYYQNQHANAWFHYFSSVVWLFSRLIFLSTLLAISGLVIVLISHYVFQTDQLIGFIIPLLLSIHSSLNYLIKYSADVEIIMVSADRIFDYCSLNAEGASNSKQRLLSNFSNSAGAIEFIDFSFKYSENVSNSLSNVSIRVSPGEKVGIIGRTGAGKSSLFNALCRLSEISEGCILIDGEDISLLDVYQHRKRISVIPQDPVLFSGTLRHNLDPFDEFTDQEVWHAIDNCNLKSTIGCIPEQLLSHVEEDGRNFSTGECQLLCLARAILRRNKLILIDEATANVDLHTDTLVQQAIRTHFSQCTVLTIAHRIDTIIDSDRILVLDKGRVVEFEVPFLMLENENSYLSKLLSHMDPYTQIKLRKLAEMSYNS